MTSIIERERIVAAAISSKHGVRSLPPPARHDTLIHAEYEEHGPSHIGVDEQGFLTNEGRFVDRVEGARVAIAADQIKGLRWPPLLYSEDLW